MKTSDLLLLGGLGLAAWYLVNKTGQAVAAIPGQVGAGLIGLPGQAAKGVTSAAQQLGVDTANALADFFQPSQIVPRAYTPDYERQIQSMQAEFQEHLARQQRILEVEAQQGPPPPGMAYVEADTGIGVMPTAPITPQQVTAALPSDFNVSPERVAYQAEIGIPITTPEQIIAAKQQAAPQEQGPPESISDDSWAAGRVVGTRTTGGVQYEIIATGIGKQVEKVRV